ncbi:MAG TPA: VWA domain-containing protein [Vicinamibacterales bacterium]|nr:VWA domain-containing protein [Vicinamibacterales bacterium]
MIARSRPLVVLLALAGAGVLAAQQSTFRSAVDAIVVPVSVTDRNRPVADLTSADFELQDDGVPQEFTLTMVDTMPTDVTFLVDTSGSVRGQALERVKVDVQKMADLLQPNDRVRLVSFARDATDVFGLLPGGATLDFSRMTSGGTTSLYDSLVHTLAAYPATDRPHMVFVVTDGRDNSSFTSADDVVAVARVSGAVLCVALVASSNPLVREGGALDAVDPLATEASVTTIAAGAGSNIVAGSTVSQASQVPQAATAIRRSAGPYRGGPNTSALKQAADLTGGLVYEDSSRTPMPQIFRHVLDDFRASYVLTYVPAGVDRGGAHTITVRAKNKRYVVRARKTYEQRLARFDEPPVHHQ